MSFFPARLCPREAPPGWADVESDDEEEHFPGFGDLNSTNGTTGKQQETETNPFLGSFDGGLLNGEWGGFKML